MASELAMLQPSDDGRTLGRLAHYEILDVLGRGGMGVVLRARDTKLDRTVAIKIMGLKAVDDSIARSRFLREARAVAAICHDHVVALHSAETIDDMPFLVMELVEGCSLREKIQEEGALDPQAVARVSLQIAEALSAAHQRGVIHRDVKPANVLLDGGIDRVRLTDFGLALLPDDLHLTKEGSLLGTPQHASPEQAEGKLTDHRSDLFSLGTVMYAMCTGKPPFEGNTPIAVLCGVRHETPPPIREISADVPQRLVEIIDKLMAKNPDDRFQSAAEVSQQLQAHLTSAPQRTTETHDEPTVKSNSKKRWLVVATLLIVFGAFAVAPWVRLSFRQESVPMPPNPKQPPIPSGKQPEVASSSRFDDSYTSDYLLTSSSYEWTTPVNLGAPINTAHDEGHASLTEDGLTLVFISNSPLGGQGLRDVWECRRKTTDDPWGNPINLGPEVNSAYLDEGSWISADGLSLIFHSLRPNEDGNSRLWTCQRTSRDQPWSQARQVTLPGAEFVGGLGPSMSKDGLKLLLCRSLSGEKDLWTIGRKGPDQAWLTMAKLSSNVNRDNSVEARPSFALDSRALLFQSNRSGATNLWAATRKQPNFAWNRAFPLGIEVQGSTDLVHPFFHVGTSTLYFSAQVKASDMGLDLWMCRRVPITDSSADDRPGDDPQ